MLIKIKSDKAIIKIANITKFSVYTFDSKSSANSAIIFEVKLSLQFKFATSFEEPIYSFDFVNKTIANAELINIDSIFNIRFSI